MLKEFSGKTQQAIEEHASISAQCNLLLKEKKMNFQENDTTGENISVTHACFFFFFQKKIFTLLGNNFVLKSPDHFTHEISSEW